MSISQSHERRLAAPTLALAATLLGAAACGGGNGEAKPSARPDCSTLDSFLFVDDTPQLPGADAINQGPCAAGYDRDTYNTTIVITRGERFGIVCRSYKPDGFGIVDEQGNQGYVNVDGAAAGFGDTQFLPDCPVEHPVPNPKNGATD